MHGYSGTKSFTVTIQPGGNTSESIPILGANRVVISRLSSASSYASMNSISIQSLVSQDNSTFKLIKCNGMSNYVCGNFFHGTDQITTHVDIDVTNQVKGFNYMKLYDSKNTSYTATCTFRVMVIK